MSECTHDCSTCSENCAERQADFRKSLHEGASVKKVIAVVSGKGGVGKSLVTAMLASEMQRRGYNAAVLDADITGPSIPNAFGVHEKATGSDIGIFPVTSKLGVDMMSINLLLENETDPVVWRGPIIAGTVKQFWTDVIWKDIDIMFIDMPPGTGDVPLTVFQSLPIDGVVVVTSPQELVGMVVQKAVNMANMMNIPVLGVVENYSYFECPDCGRQHKLFGESHIKKVAAENGVETVCRIPINPKLAAACDAGLIELYEGDWLDELTKKIETL